ncbi:MULTISPECIES: alpha/beta fold hydrolase [Legionella]|uniref:Alpha/beta hydrolase n=1 Tax=Legionella resiliens TaxID=2905958 RepID=A0ABS8X7K3_9GAMM|nr:MULTISPECIES: alpha/beta hydrolase [unclassified Legionella]MCE0724718.1 alpha/beta hydrolase [Legionella sp. 9fVS26]MCE3533872.1 alpha/beta hydrolase [Legionella sp. 8cVS16]QLZ70105.1 alpha/beta hydrolase [Legionella sp. PC1000]
MKTLKLTIPGFSIACTIWGNPDKPTILALHGWLDNANSFAPLASFLENDFYFIAVDLPGHGHSSHLPEGCHYHFFDGIFVVIEIINALKLDTVHLLGHSMGACLASLVGGVVPERFLSLSLIEGLGPFSHPAETACQQLREFAHFLAQKSKKPKGYDSISSAALARAFKGYVSLDIAKILCERSLIEKQGQYYWRHDQRLLARSPLRMTETQILSCLQEITARTYLLLSSRGFSFDPEIMNNRIKTVKNLTLKNMDGGHHIHMEQPEVISKLLAEFITT